MLRNILRTQHHQLVIHCSCMTIYKKLWYEEIQSCSYIKYLGITFNHLCSLTSTHYKFNNQVSWCSSPLKRNAWDWREESYPQKCSYFLFNCGLSFRANFSGVSIGHNTKLNKQTNKQSFCHYCNITHKLHCKSFSTHFLYMQTNKTVKEMFTEVFATEAAKQEASSRTA